MAPVITSVDVPQPREQVFAYLDVMANHEAFTDHMLTEWACSGPATGLGSKAAVTGSFGPVKERVEIEVVEVDAGRMIREQGTAPGGKRITNGTYTLSDLPGGGTHVEFAFEVMKAPAVERLLAPVSRALVRRGNERAMARLKETLAAAG